MKEGTVAEEKKKGWWGKPVTPMFIFIAITIFIFSVRILSGILGLGLSDSAVTQGLLIWVLYNQLIGGKVKS